MRAKPPLSIGSDASGRPGSKFRQAESTGKLKHMLRLSVIVWIFLILAMVIALFNVKSHVDDLNRELVQIRNDIDYETEQIRILKTEWSYLDHPDRIAELARIHLGYDTAHRPEFGQMVDLPNRVVERDTMTSVFEINAANKPIDRLGPQPNAEILELDTEIGGLRHIASPDAVGNLISDLTQ